MTRTIKLAATTALAILLSSCFSNEQLVGKGAQGTSYATDINHNMLFGSVKDESCNPEEMAGSANDYTVSTKQTFGNVMLSILTLGIYTPTKTTVTR